MQMLKKLLNSDNKYFLELDEANNSEVVQAAVKTTKQTTGAIQEKAADAVKSEPVQEAAKNGKVAGETSKKVDQASPQSAGASSYEPPFWVTAMSNTSNEKISSNGQVAEQTFASDNLMPTISKYRRRPGGSLAKFRDMAKAAKTPRK